MGRAEDLGSDGAYFTPFGPEDAAFGASLTDALAERDDAILAAYVADEASVSYPRLRAELAKQTGLALVLPVVFGSAKTGAGVDSVRAGIAELLPARAGDGDAPVSGTVFKVDRGDAGERIAYVRMFSGTLRTRDRLDDRGYRARPSGDRRAAAADRAARLRAHERGHEGPARHAGRASGSDAARHQFAELTRADGYRFAL